LAASAIVNYILAKRAERRNLPTGRFITVEGVRLHYVERGSGPPLVLLHGNGSMIQDFQSSGLIDLAAKKYRVIAFDRLKNHGCKELNQENTQDSATVWCTTARHSSDVAPQCNLHDQPFVPAWVNESLYADSRGSRHSFTQFAHHLRFCSTRDHHPRYEIPATSVRFGIERHLLQTRRTCSSQC
jgi:hypothetical protein